MFLKKNGILYEDLKSYLVLLKKILINQGINVKFYTSLDIFINIVAFVRAEHFEYIFQKFLRLNFKRSIYNLSGNSKKIAKDAFID